MEQESKELSRLKRFDDMVKNLERHVMEMDGLQGFAKFCKNGKKESLSLDNPADRYGSVSIPVGDALPYISEELRRKMKETQEIAERMKTMLCFGGFEKWNKTDNDEAGGEEHKDLGPNAMIVLVRDELEQVVNGWQQRFGVNEEKVWEAVRYWAEDWTRLLEGREKARQMKVGDRVRYIRDDKAEDGPDAPSCTGQTGIVEDIAFSRSIGDVATVKLDDNGNTIMFRIKDIEVIKEDGVTATFDREPDGLVEQFEKEKEQIPAGLGPVKYIAIAGPTGIVRKNVDGKFVDCIEIKYPVEDDSNEVKGELNRIVICHADDILNTAGGDEQRRATEEKILRKWMDAHGSWWRDYRTKVVIERGLSDKAKVKFEVHFLY